MQDVSQPEELLNQLRKIIEEAQASAAQMAISVESGRQAAEALVGIKATQTELTSAATQILAVKTKVEDLQAVVVSKSAHIQAAQEHADKVRDSLDRALTAATQDATATETQKTSAVAAATTTTESLAAVRLIKATIEADSASVIALRKTSEEAAAQSGALAAKALSIEERVTNYEKQLVNFAAQHDLEVQKITDALPGATTAGLAHFFNVRRATFSKPQIIWQVIFVISVLSIVTLTIWGLWHVFQDGKPLSYDELFRLWLARLPVVGALVWLALYSSQESALAKRLEEDYGYKATIASSFDGFKKQLSAIDAGIKSDSALAKLLENTLATIGSSPGRIYEKHPLTVTPADELTQAAKSGVAVAKAIGSQ